MNEIQKYWRDKVVSLLQAGAAIFILLVGWAVQSHKRFSLFYREKYEKIAAIGLISACSVYAIALPLAVNYIHKKFLSGETDDTVLSRRLSVLIAVALSMLTLIFAVLMSIL